MRVVVTGANGFIGAAVVGALRRSGHTAVVVDVRGADPCDIADVDAMTQRCAGADAVIHLAAIADFADCDADPMLAHRVNAGGTLAVLLAARAAGVRRVVYASTFWAYDGARAAEVDEDTPLAPPRNVYAATKLAGEHYGHAFADDLDVVLCRLGTAYGPGARDTLMTSRMIALARSGATLTVHGDGRQGRQMVYVADLADGLVAALEQGRAGLVYNLVGGDLVTVNDVVDAVRRLIGAVPVASVPSRSGEVTMPYISAARAAGELGWRPATTLDEGLTLQADALAATSA